MRVFYKTFFSAAGKSRLSSHLWMHTHSNVFLYLTFDLRAQIDIWWPGHSMSSKVLFHRPPHTSRLWHLDGDSRRDEIVWEGGRQWKFLLWSQELTNIGGQFRDAVPECSGLFRCPWATRLVEEVTTRSRDTAQTLSSWWVLSSGCCEERFFFFSLLACAR